MITAVFEEDTLATISEEVWQWDYGEVLRIQGLNLPRFFEVHFSLRKTGGESECAIGITKDGVSEVPIPRFCLTNEGTLRNYDAYAFVYLVGENSGETIARIKIRVKARPKPQDFSAPEDEEPLDRAVAMVSELADRAEAAQSAAEAARDTAKTTADGIRTDVQGLVDQAVAAKNTAIEQANISTNKAEETEADRAEVAQAKTDVTQLKAETDANLKQSAWYLQKQASMLAKVPMIYATITLEELQAVPNAKEGDFGIIQDPRGMLFRYVTHDSSGNEITPAWAWMTDLNIAFNRESLLGILSLPAVATSGKYADLLEIPNRYNAPIVLDSTGDTITWDYSQSDTAIATLTVDKPLVIGNGYNGAQATLDVYGAKLVLDDEIYLKAATYAYLEAVEGEHYHYDLQRLADKWLVGMMVVAGGEPEGSETE